LNEREKITIILTTHYLEEADFLCNRIAIIDHGKIIALDTPANLKKKTEGRNGPGALRQQRKNSGTGFAGRFFGFAIKGRNRFFGEERGHVFAAAV